MLTISGLDVSPAHADTSLGLSLAIAPTSQAKSKITKPSAPTIVSIKSSTPKSGKVDVTVTIKLPKSNGGSKITGSKVTAGGKSCLIANLKTSCTIKSIRNGKSLSVYANSKNIKGFGSKSARVIYAAGASAWPTPATVYVVGDSGPGGGIVYYVDNAGFSCGESFTNTGSPTGGKCHYLEVAPSGWNNGGTPVTDPYKVWAVSANQSADVYDITNDSSAYNNALAIGLGYKNSVAIATQNGVTYNADSNDYAAGAALAYASNSKSDWYLPTTAELNLLCQWNGGVTQDVTAECIGGTINSGTGATGSGLAKDDYWSSSEYGDTMAWYQYFGGAQSWDIKAYVSAFVRPVRAF